MLRRLPLIGGSYSSRSSIANVQRCVNLYPEVNRRDAPVPVTHYQRPGLRPLVSAPAGGPVRGLYQCSTGDSALAVIGQQVFRIPDPKIGGWKLVPLGPLALARPNPVSIIDNRSYAMIVDGSTFGYQVSLLDGLPDPKLTLSQIVDPTGIFVGADKVDYLDTFFLFNYSGTNSWGCSLSANAFPKPTFNALFTAGKVGFPDRLKSLFVNKHQILLLGLYKSEIWYDAGAPLFPFAELPGAYIEHGVLATYSLASADISVFWLGQDLQGQGMVFRQRGYNTTCVSNHAISRSIQQAIKSGLDCSDAIGWTSQIEGHIFYHLTFPSADMTWVFDDAVEDPTLAWHQEAWTDPADGRLRRHRAMSGAFLWGTNVVGDWENGTIYEVDTNTYSDTVAGTIGPCTYIRTFPHLLVGFDEQGRPLEGDGMEIQHAEFQLDAEVGSCAALPNDAEPQFLLSFSDDRGKSWTREPLTQSAGRLGKYETRPKWSGLGMAMDRVYEVSYSFPGPAALNGAWVRGQVAHR